MKRTLSLGLLVLASAAMGQTVQTARTYKVGEVEAYHMTMKMEGAMAMAMSMDTSQKVLAVYDNGDADVETTVSGMTLEMMGQKRPMPAQKSTKSRINRYGAPVEAAGKATGMGMSFNKYLMQLPQGEMKVGQSVEFDEAEPSNAKTRVKGKTTLESVTDGVGKYVTSMDVSMEGSTKPMHLEFTSMVEAATARPTHIEGRVTNLDGAPGVPKGMPITSMTIVMDRKA